MTDSGTTQNDSATDSVSFMYATTGIVDLLFFLEKRKFYQTNSESLEKHSYE